MYRDCELHWRDLLGIQELKELQEANQMRWRSNTDRSYEAVQENKQNHEAVSGSNSGELRREEQELLGQQNRQEHGQDESFYKLSEQCLTRGNSATLQEK